MANPAGARASAAESAATCAVMVALSVAVTETEPPAPTLESVMKARTRAGVWVGAPLPGVQPMRFWAVELPMESAPAP